jgi:hypothetical protein
MSIRFKKHGLMHKFVYFLYVKEATNTCEFIYHVIRAVLANGVSLIVTLGLLYVVLNPIIFLLRSVYAGSMLTITDIDAICMASDVTILVGLIIGCITSWIQDYFEERRKRNRIRNIQRQLSLYDNVGLSVYESIKNKMCIKINWD